MTKAFNLKALSKAYGVSYGMTEVQSVKNLPTQSLYLNFVLIAIDTVPHLLGSNNY